MRPAWLVVALSLAQPLSCKTPCTEKTLIDVEIEVWDFDGDCYRTVTEQRPCKFWGMNCEETGWSEWELVRSLADGRCVLNTGPCAYEYVLGNPEMLDCGLVDGCCAVRDRALAGDLEFNACPQ